MSFVYNYAQKSYIYETGFSLNNLELPTINKEEIKQEPPSTCYFFKFTLNLICGKINTFASLVTHPVPSFFCTKESFYSQQYLESRFVVQCQCESTEISLCLKTEAEGKHH